MNSDHMPRVRLRILLYDSTFPTFVASSGTTQIDSVLLAPLWVPMTANVCTIISLILREVFTCPVEVFGDVGAIRDAFLNRLNGGRCPCSG